MFLTYDSEKSDEFSGKLQQPDSQRFFLNDLYRLRVLWITTTAAPDHQWWAEEEEESSESKIFSCLSFVLRNIVHLEL